MTTPHVTPNRLICIVFFILANEFTVNTPVVYGYDLAWFVVHLNFFTFKVRACSEVRLILAEDPFVSSATSTRVHEVVVGGWQNTKSVIYKDTINNETVVETATPRILNCNEFREFWIQWQTDGNISVGEGAVGTGEFLRYTDPDPHPIHSVSISTGEGSSGQWQISSETGGSMYV